MHSQTNTPELVRILNEHQRLITEKRGLSCSWWHRPEGARYLDAPWKLHRNMMPTISEMREFREDFIACRCIMTYPRLFTKGGSDQLLSSDTKQESTSIELVRRSHVLLWTIGKSGKFREALETTALITTSQHAGLAIDVFNLLNPLLQTLREEWMCAFKTANDHQFKMVSFS